MSVFRCKGVLFFLLFETFGGVSSRYYRGRPRYYRLGAVLPPGRYYRDDPRYYRDGSSAWG